AIGVAGSRRERDDGSSCITVAGFDLVNVREAGRGLEPVVELELPPVSDHVTVEALQIRGRGAVGFDLVALSIEGAASIIVRCDVHVKYEDVFSEVEVKSLRDVAAEGRM